MKTQKSFFEENGGTYTQVGDVLLPNLTIGEEEQRPIRKYGRMRKRYLKEQHSLLYSELHELVYCRGGRHHAGFGRQVLSRVIFLLSKK